MRSEVIRGTLGAAGLVLACAISAMAQDAPVRVRGSIEHVDGQTLMIKARDGKDLTVKLADNAMVVSIVKAALSDIKPNSFVGVTALPQTDGSWHAVEVHIFPEAMRGTGEGDRPWDLHPKSTMTNGAVAETVKEVNGQTLTLKYKEGEKKITVPPDASIVTYEPGNKADLKPGAKIFIVAATKQPDGSLQAVRINVGKDGITPPM
jgi:hypothetical protein